MKVNITTLLIYRDKSNVSELTNKSRHFRQVPCCPIFRPLAPPSREPAKTLARPWQDPSVPPYIYPPSTKGGSGAVLQRDVTCRISGHSQGVDTVHLVPGMHSLWFNSNDMMRYCSERTVSQPINDNRNLLCLRKNIQFPCDARRLVFVPKLFGPVEDGTTKPQVALHVLLPCGSDGLVELYHNRSPQPLRDIAVEFLFCAFCMVSWVWSGISCIEPAS